MMRWTARWAIPCLGFAVGMLGCGKYSDYCERRNDCLGGNDKDLEACVVQAEHQEEVAGIYGCEDRWEAYFDCAAELDACNENENQICERERDEWRSCVR